MITRAPSTRFAGDWTAAPRFSRRMGETWRGVEYACSLERSEPSLLEQLVSRLLRLLRH
jgi:hypothetical protein